MSAMSCIFWMRKKYVASSANQFGTLGLVLAVATWLVGYAGVLVA